MSRALNHRILLQIVILVAASGFVLAKLLAVRDLHVGWPGVSAVFVAALVPVNLGLEVIKWRRLTDRPWGEAWRDVLAGAAAGFVSPNRTGDGVARVIRLPRSRRERGARAAMNGAAAQGWVTLAGGGLGLLVLGESMAGAVVCGLAAGGLGVLLFWSPRLRREPRGRWMKRAVDWVSAHVAQDARGPIPAWRRLEVIGWSALRYAVFTGQYVWMLQAFGVARRAAAVSVVWLVNAAVPTGALAEFGVREASALAVMQPAEEAVAGVVAATFALWTLNLLLPGLLGIRYLRAGDGNE
jgi:hypothetical protein